MGPEYVSPNTIRRQTHTNNLGTCTHRAKSGWRRFGSRGSRMKLSLLAAVSLLLCYVLAEPAAPADATTPATSASADQVGDEIDETGACDDVCPFFSVFFWFTKGCRRVRFVLGFFVSGKGGS